MRIIQLYHLLVFGWIFVRSVWFSGKMRKHWKWFFLSHFACIFFLFLSFLPRDKHWVRFRGFWGQFDGKFSFVAPEICFHWIINALFLVLNAMSLILSLLLRASSVVIGFQTVLGWENRIFYIFCKSLWICWWFFRSKLPESGIWYSGCLDVSWIAI